MKAAIVEIGKKYDRTAEATKLVSELEGKITAVRMKAELNESPKVLILLGIPGSYLVATENSYIGDLVRKAGGQNVMNGQEPEYLPSNTEFYNKAIQILLFDCHMGCLNKLWKCLMRNLLRMIFGSILTQ